MRESYLTICAASVDPTRQPTANKFNVYNRRILMSILELLVWPTGWNIKIKQCTTEAWPCQVGTEESSNKNWPDLMSGPLLCPDLFVPYTSQYYQKAKHFPWNPEGKVKIIWLMDLGLLGNFGPERVFLLFRFGCYRAFVRGFPLVAVSEKNEIGGK